jgi:hypothetical protein
MTEYERHFVEACCELVGEVHCAKCAVRHGVLETEDAKRLLRDFEGDLKTAAEWLNRADRPSEACFDVFFFAEEAIDSLSVLLLGRPWWPEAAKPKGEP